jgi:3-methylcrotonyl-CoA carboxylase alpha subunit
MIAKLIVSGPTRELAIQKLYAALQEYEVVGVSTNIEFVKKMCQSSDFIAGNVETGYIAKHDSELFAPDSIEPEIFAQAGLSILAKELSTPGVRAGPHGQLVGFGASAQRQVHLVTSRVPDVKPVVVTINQANNSLFDITVKSEGGFDATYSNVLCQPQTPSISTFFPHTRIESTVIQDGDKLTVFQQGKKLELELVKPSWYEKALGLKDLKHSVVAPMPCKVLRNEVKEGDMVEKDQALVVIESMKMETVIRSPQAGIVAKLVHKEGVSSGFCLRRRI